MARQRLNVLTLLLVVALVASSCGGTGLGATDTDAVAASGDDEPQVLGRPIDPDEVSIDLPSEGPYQGSFQTFCGYSHSLQDDPIVSPGVPGVSHLHDFFGNVGIDATSDYETALADDSTCAIKQDTASYWTPAVFLDGVPIVPTQSLAYYRVADGVALEDVVPFPADLMMVAGNQSSTEPQDPTHAGWSCGNSPNITAEPTECAGSSVRLRLVFPDCWNGEDLRSLDNSHVARSGSSGCPDTHPVVMPELEFSVMYPPFDPRAEMRLASGSALTAHGDFWNAWNQDRLANEVARCLRRNVYC